MFREGYYLEIIKTKNSAATAVITVKEKTVEIKKKKITTNKWLTLEDWSSLYETLEKALIQNSEKNQGTEKKKFTRHLEIVYAFETSENPSTRTSLPTIRVGVSFLKKKSGHKTSSTKKSDSEIEPTRTSNDTSSSTNLKVNKKLQTYTPTKVEKCFLSNGNTCRGTIPKVEEYIPDVPKTRSADNEADLKYVPSRKSTLEYLLHSGDSNEYIPSLVKEETVTGKALDTLYVPNSIPTSLNYYETYEPSSSAINDPAGDEYIPNSKGVKKKTEEYQPDFTSKTMKFDDSYVPSSSEKIKEMRKINKKFTSEGSSSSSSSISSTSSSTNSKSKKKRTRESDSVRKESSKKKTSPLKQSTTIKREM